MKSYLGTAAEISDFYKSRTLARVVTDWLDTRFEFTDGSSLTLVIEEGGPLSDVSWESTRVSYLVDVPETSTAEPAHD